MAKYLHSKWCDILTKAQSQPSKCAYAGMRINLRKPLQEGIPLLKISKYRRWKFCLFNSQQKLKIDIPPPSLRDYCYSWTVNKYQEENVPGSFTYMIKTEWRLWVSERRGQCSLYPSSPALQCYTVPTGGRKQRSGHSSLNVQCPPLMSQWWFHPNAWASLLPWGCWMAAVCIPCIPGSSL